MTVKHLRSLTCPLCLLRSARQHALAASRATDGLLGVVVAKRELGVAAGGTSHGVWPLEFIRGLTSTDPDGRRVRDHASHNSLWAVPHVHQRHPANLIGKRQHPPDHALNLLILADTNVHVTAVLAACRRRSGSSHLPHHRRP